MKRSTSSLNRAHSRGSFSRLVFESESNNGGGDKDRSILFRLCQLVVVCFRLVTPASYAFLGALWWFEYNPIQDQNILLLILTSWMCSEAIFFPYYYYLFLKLSKLNSQLEHVASTKETRTRLVHNCFNALKLAASSEATGTDPEVYVRKVLEGWFLDVPLINVLRGNIASWCGWSFFGKDVDDMSADEHEENEEIVSYIEKQAKWTFPDGKKEGLLSARLTLDPIFATQRPFMVYAVIYIVNTITHIVLWFMGYKKRYEFSTSSQPIYYRPGNNSMKGRSPFPLVFIHGIGIGFTHYLASLISLPTEVDVYLVEWPHVAMQMASTPPPIDESVAAVIAVLDRDGHSKACFAAHSLGTTFVSWILHHPEGCKRVSSTILVDPVTFLLCDPNLATTFVYKDPATEIDFLMHFFLSRELFISNAISRHFSWSHNIMFVEDLAAVDDHDAHSYSGVGQLEVARAADAAANRKVGRVTRSSGGVGDGRNTSSPETVEPLKLNHTIILSSHDSIVPVAKVTKYLEAKLRQGHTCFEVLMFHGTHGELFIYPKWITLIAAKVRDRCGLPAVN